MDLSLDHKEVVPIFPDHYLVCAVYMNIHNQRGSFFGVFFLGLENR
jgi:hypothetical protein